MGFWFGFVSGFAVWAAAMLGVAFVAAVKYGKREPD